MAEYPNLKGVATKDLVEDKGPGRTYINWSRTMQLLRDHAPGWQPEAVMAADMGIVHDPGYLFIRFVHLDGTTTPCWPQAIMDNRNNAIPLSKATARDITDAHRRGVCAAAAGLFGLAYELWARMELENPYREPAGSAKEPVDLPALLSAIAGAGNKDQAVALASSAGQLSPADDALVKTAVSIMSAPSNEAWLEAVKSNPRHMALYNKLIAIEPAFKGD